MRNHVDMAVLEVCTFTATGDEQALRAADARFQVDFAYQQPGLFRRTTARGDHGRWCVVTLWGSLDDAVRGEQAAEGDAVAAAFWDLVDRDSVRVERFSLLE
jgi:hypothetical protein